uniref:Uncharacterized protein n=1 Tax=Physcomitrium patens TaxID=3218 RepID=A0A2K1JGK5_PHYPA|nr:hypothetical protein PHYPA_018098 [Physcomitrium patens]
MAHKMLRVTEADGWERSDFPITCDCCLGDNPYVRMTKANFEKECKICIRPFTVFCWRSGRDARYEKTEVCQTYSKLKNVCQVCLLDLEYGLPVQVRDTALGINTSESIPKSDAKAGLDYESFFDKARPTDAILKLQRTTPYYKRNCAHICSFYVREECTRGSECPYRHEMPVTGELSQQNIKDRYYGYVDVNDPVAAKLLRKAGEMPSLAPPEDMSIKTLYVGGLIDRVTEEDLKVQSYSYGEIESIRMVRQRACAFVTYTTREGAEEAADHLANKLVINGLRLKLMWQRPQIAKAEMEAAGGKNEEGTSTSAFGILSHGGMLPRALIPQQHLHPDSSGAEQGGSSNSEQRPQPGQYDGRPMGPPPYGYSQQGPPPHFQHQHFRGPPPCAQGGRPSLSYQLYPPHLQGGSLQFFRPL